MNKVVIYLILIFSTILNSYSQVLNKIQSADSIKTNQIDFNPEMIYNISIVDSLDNMHTGRLISYSDSLITLKLDSGGIEQINSKNTKFVVNNYYKENYGKIGFAVGTPGLLNIIVGSCFLKNFGCMASLGVFGSQLNLSYNLNKNQKSEFNFGIDIGSYYSVISGKYFGFYIENISNGFLVHVGANIGWFSSSSFGGNSVGETYKNQLDFQLGYVFRIN